MMTNSKIGTALVGGYLLGRTKKAKVAVGLGMLLAGKKLSLEPQQLLKAATANPLVSQLTDQVRGELLGATKTAASSALTKRVNHLADSLHERVQGLTAPAADAGETAGGALGDTVGAAKRGKRGKQAEFEEELPEDDEYGDAEADDADERDDDPHEDDDAEDTEAEDTDEADEAAADDERPAAKTRRTTRSTSASAPKSAAKKTARRPAQAAGSSSAPASGARKKTASKSSSPASSGTNRRSTGTRRNGGDRG